MEALGEQLHCRLRRPVHGLARNGEEATHARHVDDVPLRPRNEDRQEGLGQVHGVEPVDGKDPLDGVVVEVLEAHEGLDDPCAVDDPVYGAEPIGYRNRQGLRLRPS